MPSSPEIEGSRGAKINRLIKDRKNKKVRNIIFPIASLKSSGVGHALSVINNP
jgi:hypothetical protein